MTRQHYEEFNVGDRVRASDGTKRPPDRWNRKLDDWRRRNFTGTVDEVNEPYYWPDGRVSAPNGGLVLIDDRHADRSWIHMRFHHNLGGAVQFEKLAEAEAA